MELLPIDFPERQEVIEDILKMEGTLMGLQLAKDTYSEIAPLMQSSRSFSILSI